MAGGKPRKARIWAVGARPSGSGVGRLGINAKSQAKRPNHTAQGAIRMVVPACSMGTTNHFGIHMREKRPGPGRPKGPARKRVQVTLSLEAWAMVEEIAELTNAPKASILAEMFDAILPSFVATIQALRVAKAQPREAQRLVQNFAAERVQGSALR